MEAFFSVPFSVNSIFRGVMALVVVRSGATGANVGSMAHTEGSDATNHVSFYNSCFLNICFTHHVASLRVASEEGNAPSLLGHLTNKGIFA